ncbi:MAG: metallophosphoesterase family protein [Pseudomonadota bacterium]
MDSPLYVVGDIHGRFDLLDHLFQLIEADIAQRPPMAPCKVIYLGDYIDRGDHSAQVLKRLYTLNRHNPHRHICLKGNHEAMLVQFLSHPAKYGRRWLHYGGIQTVASYGVRGVYEGMPKDDLLQMARDMHALLGTDVIQWLRRLPLVYKNGNVVCVHADLDPRYPWDDQPDEVCLWGRAGHTHRPRADNNWVLHGHTIVDQVTQTQGYMAIDTGAYATGRLTALGLYQDQSWVVNT